MRGRRGGPRRARPDAAARRSRRAARHLRGGLVSDVLALLVEVCEAAAAHGVHAEARWVHTRDEALAVRNGEVSEVRTDVAEGIGIRVRVGGGWGFAATREVSSAGAHAALTRAIAVARAQPVAAAGPFAPLAHGPARGHWAGPCEVDPFALSLEARLAHLHAAEAALRADGDARIVVTSAHTRSRRTRTALASTDGAACTQERTETGAGVQAVAADGEETQVRSYPMSHDGDVLLAGWELVTGLDLAGHAPRVAAEAVELLTAPVCPEGVRDVVLHGEQLALQVHESIGHALELDRILLGEASYAGTSWVQADALRAAGSLRYGSEHLHVTADATLPAALGSFGWDDEGVAARRFPLIEEGVLLAALSARQSAAEIGLEESGGCARADGFARQPIVRMTNVSLEPGSAGSFADLLADTESGLYLETNRSWSIDDRRLQFQFATEVAREIRGGELGRLYRNPSYAGVTPEFWGSMDAVCSASEWRPWSFTNCGKGEPGQVMAVSHGTAPARFRGVQVGVA
ncbi:TldD/PmbA family protein [Conexibacter sp. W3-3-2]|nr:TldD/PmbA family protein [Conexibacter sp. W3-3-2]